MSGADDAAGGRVDRHRQPEADAGHRRVDADHPRAAVGEGAARVAGVEGGVGLDDVLHDPPGPRAAHRQGPPSAETTPAVTDPANPSGLPIATTSWPTSRRVGVAERRRRAGRRPRRGAPPGRRAGRPRRPSSASSRPSTRRARRAPSAPSTTWAEVRTNPSGVITTPLPRPWAPPRRPDPDAHHRGPEGARDGRHRARVGVERLVVARTRSSETSRSVIGRR